MNLSYTPPPYPTSAHNQHLPQSLSNRLLIVKKNVYGGFYITYRYTNPDFFPPSSHGPPSPSKNLPSPHPLHSFNLPHHPSAPSLSLPPPLPPPPLSSPHGPTNPSEKDIPKKNTENQFLYVYTTNKYNNGMIFTYPMIASLSTSHRIKISMVRLIQQRNGKGLFPPSMNTSNIMPIAHSYGGVLLSHMALSFLRNYNPMDALGLSHLGPVDYAKMKPMEIAAGQLLLVHRQKLQHQNFLQSTGKPLPSGGNNYHPLFRHQTNKIMLMDMKNVPPLPCRPPLPSLPPPSLFPSLPPAQHTPRLKPMENVVQQYQTPLTMQNEVVSSPVPEIEISNDVSKPIASCSKDVFLQKNPNHPYNRINTDTGSTSHNSDSPKGHKDSSEDENGCAEESMWIDDESQVTSRKRKLREMQIHSGYFSKESSPCNSECDEGVVREVEFRGSWERQKENNIQFEDEQMGWLEKEGVNTPGSARLGDLGGLNTLSDPFRIPFHQEKGAEEVDSSWGGIWKKPHEEERWEKAFRFSFSIFDKNIFEDFFPTKDLNRCAAMTMSNNPSPIRKRQNIFDSVYQYSPCYYDH